MYKYQVIDKKTNAIRFESYNVNECYKYVDIECCFSSTIIRKVWTHK